MRLALVGFGHVGRAFARLLLQKQDLLRRRHRLDPRVTAALEIDTDVAGRLVVSLHDPHVEQTAFALLADLASLPVR